MSLKMLILFQRTDEKIFNSKYFVFIVSNHSNLPDIVSKVLSQEMQKIFVNKDLESFNEDFLKHNATSLQHLLSGQCLTLRVKTFMEEVRM